MFDILVVVHLLVFAVDIHLVERIRINLIDGQYSSTV